MSDNPNGRPPIFTSPDDFRAVADDYFNSCVDGKIPTVNGLSIALGMTRETLLRYAEKDGFSDTVKLIRARLEDSWEQRLAGPNAAGTIFWLKNQGWTDKNETALTGANGGPVETVTRIKLADLEG